MSCGKSGYQAAAGLIDRETIGDDVVVIDLRSDTVTKPDGEMREAMARAVVGDDVYREDPTVNDLERKGAEMMGKEAALFVPSGTMANLIALLCHCATRGSEAIVGDESHILHYEQTGACQFGGISLRAVRTLPDGTLDLEEVERKIRNGSDVHQSRTSVICLENTHNRCGGRILPVDWTLQAAKLAKKRGLKLHLDGARIFNAAVALGLPAAQLAEPFDSVSVCLSKGLGAPVGSLLVGSKDLIRQALRCRKALGGGMRQAGILAAAGILALERGPSRMVDDHRFVKRLALVARESGTGLVDVDLDVVETNMVMIRVKSLGAGGLTTTGLTERLARPAEDHEERRHLGGRDVRLLAYPMTETNVRIVVHCNITEEQVVLAEKKLAYVLHSFQSL